MENKNYKNLIIVLSILGGILGILGYSVVIRASYSMYSLSYGYTMASSLGDIMLFGALFHIIIAIIAILIGALLSGRKNKLTGIILIILGFIIAFDSYALFSNLISYSYYTNDGLVIGLATVGGIVLIIAGILSLLNKNIVQKSSEKNNESDYSEIKNMTNNIKDPEREKRKNKFFLALGGIMFLIGFFFPVKGVFIFFILAILILLIGIILIMIGAYGSYVNKD